MRQLILASTSGARRRMLAEAGLDVVALDPGVDEDAPGLRDPVALAETLALRKAEAVQARRPEALILGADQVAWDPGSGEIWGKPPDDAAHLRMLRRMRGRVHHLVTGYAVLAPGSVQVGHQRTELEVRADLDDDELVAYVRTGEGRGCAGGYAAEGLGSFLFERIDGDWYNVMGLPLFGVLSALRRHGWRFSAGAR